MAERQKYIHDWLSLMSDRHIGTEWLNDRNINMDWLSDRHIGTEWLNDRNIYMTGCH